MTVIEIEDQVDEPRISVECPSREYPVIHAVSDIPLCFSCQQLDLPYFDLGCPECVELLHSKETTVSQIFAILRQWMPQTQQNIQIFVKEILERGGHVDDRDGLTDMTLLHYACKAGAVGVGDAASATQTVKMLLQQSCDVHLRCRWTDMSVLHYAAYFDVVPVLELLLESNNELDINSPSQEFDGGSCLHIAAANLCLDTAKFLLQRNANISLKDQLERTPYDCIPEYPTSDNMIDINNFIGDLRSLLENERLCYDKDNIDYSAVTGRTILKSLNLKLGDKIVVGGAKIGNLRYCGTTKFASGIWAGVELEEPLGKNDGTVDSVTYFKCLPFYGIFAPISKIHKYGESLKNSAVLATSQRSLLQRHTNYKKIDISHVTSKIETGLNALKSQILPSEAKELKIGDKICIGGRNGIIKYVGETKFAPGIWYGIELEDANGKNSGSVQNIKYFNCRPNHGLFVSAFKLAKLQKYSDEMSSQSSLGKSSNNGRNSTDSENQRIQSSPNVSRLPKKIRCSTSSANSSNNIKNVKGCWLTVGMNVFVNNEIATVKYLGKVAFAEGIWIGVELRKPKGKNDGSVQGYRYFTCKPYHGLMVRPNRITARGINGSKLIAEKT